MQDCFFYDFFLTQIMWNILYLRQDIDKLCFFKQFNSARLKNPFCGITINKLRTILYNIKKYLYILFYFIWIAYSIGENNNIATDLQMCKQNVRLVLYVSIHPYWSLTRHHRKETHCGTVTEGILFVYFKHQQECQQKNRNPRPSLPLGRSC